MMLWQEWWVWALAGLLLAMLEVVLPGFILLGFAIGAGVTGLSIWLGILGGSLPVLLLVTAVVALVAWWVLRSALGVRKGQTKIWNKDINEN